jgi:stage II sporulation protein D
MRKILLYLIIFVLICFFLPVIFTPKSQNTAKTMENLQPNESGKEQIAESTYDYKDYKEINLYHTETKKTEKVPLDEYLYGVVSAEMPASFEEEALKAQAVVARTYTLYKIQNSKR